MEINNYRWTAVYKQTALNVVKQRYCIILSKGYLYAPSTSVKFVMTYSIAQQISILMIKTTSHGCVYGVSEYFTFSSQLIHLTIKETVAL